MSDRMNSAAQCGTCSRRQVIAGVVVALTGLVACSEVRAKTVPQEAKEAPARPENAHKTALHQEIDFSASPQRIYEVLLDSKQFAAMTGLSADIDPNPGGAFKAFGGLIMGRNVELILHQRIVQAWRPGSWDPGVYSIVRFELRPRGSETTVVLDHTGFPEGDFDGLNAGWNPRYWAPLKKFVG
jgi:activator of HSP90 ATPase